MKNFEKTKLYALCFLKILLSFISCWLIVGCSPFFGNSKLSSPGPSTKNTANSQDVGGIDSKIISQGTKVDDLDLSNTPVSEAPMKIEGWAKDKLEESRVLLYNETEIPITLKELGFDLDTEKIVEGTQNNPNAVTPSVLKVNSLLASQTLKEKLKKFSLPAKDAAYKIENDKVVIKPAQNGQAAAIDQLIGDLQKSPLSEVPKQIKVPTVEVPASVSTEAVKSLAFDSVIGEFSTKFAVQETNRSANLTAAAKALDRQIIQPGATFSFNKTVGPRETENGYKEAYIIINGEYVKGTGGGVCQVSSTLYNAVLLSNLDVVERRPHDVAVSYVPPGLDATVNYPNVDFKFKNNTANLVYLRTDVNSGVLTIRLYGKKTGQIVQLERKVEKVTKYRTERRKDASLPRGKRVLDQSGSKGIVVNVWKVRQDEKGNVTKQFLGRNSYAPANRIWRIGI